MANITDIAQIEERNTGQINLFREGLFWKVYNVSAYFFHKNIKPEYQVNKRNYKTLGHDMAAIGFPTSFLEELVNEQQDVVSKSEEMVVLRTANADVDGYVEWYKSLPVYVPKPSTKTGSNQKINAYDNSQKSEVIDKIVNFRIESSTPMECMLFLSELKKSIAQRDNGNI